MITTGGHYGHRAATVGMFDGVHLGHRQVIAQVSDVAQRFSLVPTVFTFDRHPMSLIAPDRAPKLLTTNAQKSNLIVEAGADDVELLVFDDSMRHKSAAEFLAMLHHDYSVDRLVVGFNHHFGHDRKGSFDEYRHMGEQIGIQLVKAEEYSGAETGMHISSSAIRKALAEGDIMTANRMLGYPFAISGYVAHGRNIGAKIGFPTANVTPYLSSQLIPKEGVYAATVDLGSLGCYPAMVNVGTNPTIKADTHPLTIEAHIIGFSADIYGRPITVAFNSRLRDERTFDTLEALTAQLNHDLHTLTRLVKNQGRL